MKKQAGEAACFSMALKDARIHKLLEQDMRRGLAGSPGNMYTCASSIWAPSKMASLILSAEIREET